MSLPDGVLTEALVVKKEFDWFRQYADIVIDRSFY